MLIMLLVTASSYGSYAGTDCRLVRMPSLQHIFSASVGPLPLPEEVNFTLEQ
jgi:hypothetical protein